MMKLAASTKWSLLSSTLLLLLYMTPFRPSYWKPLVEFHCSSNNHHFALVGLLPQTCGLLPDYTNTGSQDEYNPIPALGRLTVGGLFR